jgi:uncharacterized membrane protein
MAKLVTGIILNFAGLALIFLRRTLLESLAGKTRIKLGLFFGVDRVHTALFILLIIGMALIVVGVLLIIWSFRTPAVKEKTVVAENKS